ncbi:MAG: von Willebrand factor type domain protein [Myxococcaceae bacterium]|nr:von Willebrand factor type domain protein [Myxococcaceae bacterium]
MKRVLAAAVALSLASCALRSSPASKENEAATPEYYQQKAGKQPPSETTALDFEGDTVEGELTRPDGEYTEARKKVKQSTVLQDPAQLPSPDPHAPRPPKTGEGGEGDDFDQAFGRGDVARQPGPTVPADAPQVQMVPIPESATEEVPPTGAQRTGKVSGMYLQHYGVNPTIETSDEATSTFAADVDTASYSLARAWLGRGELPHEGAVRVEEFINSFDYAYRPPEKEAFAVQVEVFPSPNRKGYHVLHLGLKGKEVRASERKAANLIFTLDVSGSMAQENRLGLAKRALELLVDQLEEKDTVALVVYGDAGRLVLPPTPANQRAKILAAIAALRPEGATNVQAGLEIAYAQALKAFKPGGINRVVLCSDGVANNGVTTADALFAKVKARASEGITLTAVGFGMGNYNDVLMERLADQGNGNYAYVDRLDEAKRIFVEQLTGTLEVIAKDVKLQLEFNPAAVERYRLIGFENRVLDKRDFANDKVDAGELGAGHAVTALYELKLRRRDVAKLATFRARFKQPDGHTSALVERALPMSIVRDELKAATGPARLSLVVAGFAEKLRGSYWARNLKWDELLAMWEQLPPPLRERQQVAELRLLILAARRLDTRGDRFEKEAPLASMDFDRVPVLR